MLDGNPAIAQGMVSRIEIVKGAGRLADIGEEFVQGNAAAAVLLFATLVQALEKVLLGQFGGNDQNAGRGSAGGVADFVQNDLALSIQEPIGVQFHQVVVVDGLDELKGLELLLTAPGL